MSFILSGTIIPEIGILKYFGFIFLFIYILFAYFGFYKRLDDLREKYSSDRKSIDYITQSNYKATNINTNDDIIDSYDTSKRGYKVSMNSSNTIILK